MISKVVRTEKELFQIKALTQGQQGRWTTWEWLISRTIGWADMWKIPATSVCGMAQRRAANSSVPQVRVCSTSLSRCKHKVLHNLAEILEVRRVETARERLPPTRQPIHFVREGRRAHNIIQLQRSALSRSCDWKLRINLDRQLRLLTEITATNLQPDIILWSVTARQSSWQSSRLGCRGFVGASTKHFLKSVEVTGPTLKKVLKVHTLRNTR